MTGAVACQRTRAGVAQGESAAVCNDAGWSAVGPMTYAVLLRAIVLTRPLIAMWGGGAFQFLDKHK
jgi:hypothetical protein